MPPERVRHRYCGHSEWRRRNAGGRRPRLSGETIDRYGVVNLLVNSAGVTGGGPYGEWTDVGWDWTVAVILQAVVAGIEVLGPLIESCGEGGQFICTASAGGLVTLGSNPYNVTKFGVVAASRGIGVSVSCPGFRIRIPVRSGFGAVGWRPNTPRIDAESHR